MIRRGEKSLILSLSVYKEGRHIETPSVGNSP